MKRALASLLFCACGATAAPAPPPAKPPISTAQAPDEWSPLTWEDKHDAMTWRVLPAMTPVFQQVFETKEPSLNCRTCHGPNAEAVQYKLPNSLPALDPRHMPQEKIADSMKTVVVPRMRELLGTEVTCFTCHPKGGTS